MREYLQNASALYKLFERFILNSWISSVFRFYLLLQFLIHLELIFYVMQKLLKSKLMLAVANVNKTY